MFTANFLFFVLLYWIFQSDLLFYALQFGTILFVKGSPKSYNLSLIFSHHINGFLIRDETECGTSFFFVFLCNMCLGLGF